MKNKRNAEMNSCESSKKSIEPFDYICCAQNDAMNIVMSIEFDDPDPEASAAADAPAAPELLPSGFNNDDYYCCDCNYCS